MHWRLAAAIAGAAVCALATAGAHDLAPWRHATRCRPSSMNVTLLTNRNSRSAKVSWQEDLETSRAGRIAR
jgi:hypothetical protein